MIGMPEHLTLGQSLQAWYALRQAAHLLPASWELTLTIFYLATMCCAYLQVVSS